MKTMVPEHVVHLVRPYGLAQRARPAPAAPTDPAAAS
jgi:hypothetical protein